MTADELAAALKFAREDAGLTRREAARRLRVSEPTLTVLERGEHGGNPRVALAAFVIYAQSKAGVWEDPAKIGDEAAEFLKNQGDDPLD